MEPINVALQLQLGKQGEAAGGDAAALGSHPTPSRPGRGVSLRTGAANTMISGMQGGKTKYLGTAQ